MYTNETQLQAIIVVTNQNNTFESGLVKPEYETNTWLLREEKPLIGLYGTAHDDKIHSLGYVTIDPTLCLVI